MRWPPLLTGGVWLPEQLLPTTSTYRPAKRVQFENIWGGGGGGGGGAVLYVTMFTVVGRWDPSPCVV